MHRVYKSLKMSHFTSSKQRLRYLSTYYLVPTCLNFRAKLFNILFVACSIKSHHSTSTLSNTKNGQSQKKNELLMMVSPKVCNFFVGYFQCINASLKISSVPMCTFW